MQQITEEIMRQNRLTPQTILRIKEEKIDSGAVKSYAMTVERFIEIANKNHYLGSAIYFAANPVPLEKQLTDAIAIHEELNRCEITATREV